MPVIRTPDGRIVEKKTKVSPLSRAGSDAAPPDPDPTTAKRDGGVAATDSARRRGTETTVVRRPKTELPDAGTVGRPPRGGDEPTRLVGSIPTGADGSKERSPVAGWLVIVEGPGAGRDLRIGVGRNALGRDADNRIALPFGDTRISRKAHLWVTYDPRNRAFSIAPGNSSNLAHLDGAAIEQRLPLPDGATITVGRTTLRFVGFCGDGFNWPDAD